jgi:Coenzyme PQQ synthesis protein D (PqqD)
MDWIRIANSVRASTSDDGLVLLDVAGGLVFAANPVSARIWQLLERQCSCEEIVHHVTADYDVPLDRARRDVEAFVDALRSRGLVLRTEPGEKR